MQHHRIFVTFAILAVMIGLSSQSQAGTYCWTNARGDGDWTKPGNFVVVNAPSSGNIAVPMTLSNVSGLDDISGWSLSVNGKSKSSALLTASDAGFAITSPGMLIIVR